MTAVLPAPHEEHPSRFNSPSPADSFHHHHHSHLSSRSGSVFFNNYNYNYNHSRNTGSQDFPSSHPKPSDSECCSPSDSQSSASDDSTAPSSPELPDTSPTSESPVPCPPIDPPSLSLFAPSPSSQFTLPQNRLRQNRSRNHDGDGCCAGGHDDYDDDEIALPSFDSGSYVEEQQETPKDNRSADSTPTLRPSSPSSTLDDSVSDILVMPRTAGDDSSVEREPTRHVDYLGHDWREEDICSSWKYIVNRRNAYKDSVRLENASWRSWAKYKFQLGTVRPESLNWCVCTSFALYIQFLSSKKTNKKIVIG